MKKIIITGVLSQPFGSWPVATQSDDGITWDQLSIPWSSNDSPTSIATNGTIVAISNGRGYLATSTDLIGYSQVTVYDGFYISSLIESNGWWIAAGQKYYNQSYGHYLPRSDIAQIHRSASANGLWTMAWIHPSENSFIYQCKKFINAKITESVTTDVIVAVGSIGNQGDAWYSLDDGFSWVQIAVPAGVGRLLSIQYASVGNSDYWYWGSNNNLYKTEFLTTNTWLEAAISIPASVVEMQSDDTSLLCAGQKQLQITQDGATFDAIINQGYIVDRVQILPVSGINNYLAFFRSNLTQYTYMISDDGVNWQKLNNNVCVTSSTLNL